MILPVALLAFLLPHDVIGDITGQHPTAGTCLCVTGTNVNARSSGTDVCSLNVYNIMFESHSTIQPL